MTLEKRTQAGSLCHMSHVTSPDEVGGGRSRAFSEAPGGGRALRGKSPNGDSVGSESG